jgi:4-hydroxy-tetrahydrodipicolinate synthase
MHEATSPHLRGIITATLTPFVSETGSVDLEWIPPHLRFLESHGIAGVLALGTTGEGASLALEERKQVLERVLAQRGGLFVFAGTACAALPETIALSCYALERGANAVLVAPPFYFKQVPEEGVLRYFQALCDALPATARVILYHIPAVTGVPITRHVISGLLASHGDQFYGIKDSSGDQQHTADLVAEFPRLHIYSGSDSQLATSLAAGVAGAISALSNVWPDRVRAVLDAHQSGSDTTEAVARLLDVRQLVRDPNTPPTLKAALPATSGLPRTSVRAPLVNLSEQESEQLRAAIAAL